MVLSANVHLHYTRQICTRRVGADRVSAMEAVTRIGKHPSLSNPPRSPEGAETYCADMFLGIQAKVCVLLCNNKQFQCAKHVLNGGFRAT